MQKSPIAKILMTAVLAGWVLPMAVMAEDSAEKKEYRKKKPNKEMMKKYDADGDGTISAEEKAAMMKDKKAKKAEFMKKYDTDGDGKLSMEEKAEMKKAKMEAKKAAREAKEKASDMMEE
ncbi:hypothetical protein P0Y35_14225 [Kiritimatiellaeota bacterium B1221]|nr:hypothetical protein [Kiritimatiellaeota bacterium B1221]